MQKKSSEHKSDSEAPKRHYVRPKILMVEQLEAVAVDCSPSGKEVSGAPRLGGGTCGFSSS